jgi:hypothetical protein
MKIEEVVPFANAVVALFDANYAVLRGFDVKFKNPYKTDVLLPKIAAASGVIITLGKRDQNKEDTKSRNLVMDEDVAIIKDLKYWLEACIADGTITDSLGSFVLGSLSDSISKHNINAFHTAYEAVYSKITETDNAAALAAKGFDADKVAAFKDVHDRAMEFQGDKVILKVEISELSEANQLILNACKDECMVVVKGLRSLAETTGNKDLKAKATEKALLKTFRPTPAKKPRKRHIKKASSVILTSKMVAKNIWKIKLLTDVKVMMCRKRLKTDECTDGTLLPFNVEIEVKKKDIEGEGEYVKFTNLDTSKKAVVQVFEVVVELT